MTHRMLFHTIKTTTYICGIYHAKVESQESHYSHLKGGESQHELKLTFADAMWRQGEAEPCE